MHSSNYEFSATELATNLQAMRDVLQEPVLHSYQSATTAIAAINDVCFIMAIHGQADNIVIGLCEHSSF